MLRRHFLFAGLATVAAPAMVRASINEKPRHLFLHHSHTGEELDVVYRSREGVSGSAAKKLDHFFRDFRTEEATQMDPALFDLLYDLKARVRNPDGVIEIISAYRSPVTNEMLRKKSSGVARKSFHTRGQALDIRLRGTSTSQLKKIALAMGRGGVGYYRRSDFIHVDTGPVRTW